LGCELVRHFQRFLEKGYLKLGFLVLTLPILGLSLRKSQPSLSLQEIQGLPFGHPIPKSELSCEQVLKLADLGRQKFGGIGAKNIFSSEKAVKIAQVFADKLDPEKMIYTAQEIEELKNLTQIHWSRLVEKSSCEAWQTWLGRIYPKAQQRIAFLVKEFRVAVTEPTQTLQRKKIRSRKYSDFAKTKAEFESRWKTEFNQILSQSSESLIHAYGADLEKLLWDRVEQNFFDRAPEAQGLLAKALLGALDSYSTYFSSVEFEEFYEELKGTASGLGLQLQKVPQGFLVEKVIEDSSAERSHQLHEGDLIEKVDNQDLAGLSFEEAKRIMKGPENTLTQLGILCSHDLKSGSKLKRLDLTLERTQFELEETKINFAWRTGHSQMGKSPKVGVITVPTFYGRGGMGAESAEKSVSEDLRQKMSEELSKEESHLGLVLDLRGNPGGYLEEAVAMGSVFVGSKPMVGVSEDGSTRVLREESAVTSVYQKPLVVLVDQGSASAAEVLSGALKDYQRAVIVGTQRTYGKGTVQKLFHLEDPLLLTENLGSLGTGVLKLTTSVFYSPLGHTPANGGVQADIALRKYQGPGILPNPTQDISPLVDSHLLSELESASAHHSEVIRLLKEKSRERLSESKSHRSDSELDEAVAIVSDLAELSSF
jgi:C-terminal peptidase prc